MTYQFAFPRAVSPIATGTLVIMTDQDATVDVIEPCTAGTMRYFPTPTAPTVIPICDAAQYRRTGPDPGYTIFLGRVDNALPLLHVAFKINGFAAEDAFLVLPRDPDRRGNSYWTLGHAPTGRWLATADSPVQLSLQTCADTPDLKLLAAGDVFQQICVPFDVLEDGTGSPVKSIGLEKFGLVTGATCAFVPTGVLHCDPLAEMLPGEDWWGTEYLVTEFNKNPAFLPGDLIRIVSTGGSPAAPNVATFTPAGGGAVAPNGSSGNPCQFMTGHTFTGPGQWCDIMVEVGATITSTSAIVVGQLMKGNDDAGVGDPSLSLVLPTNRFRCGGRFFSFDGYDLDVEGNGSYVNIVAPTLELGGILLDLMRLDSGVTCLGYNRIDFTPAGYSWTKCLLANPPAPGVQHILDSGATPIGVYVYGQKRPVMPTTSGEASYAYVAGMSFAP